MDVGIICVLKYVLYWFSTDLDHNICFVKAYENIRIRFKINHMIWASVLDVIWNDSENGPIRMKSMRVWLRADLNDNS